MKAQGRYVLNYKTSLLYVTGIAARWPWAARAAGTGCGSATTAAAGQAGCCWPHARGGGGASLSADASAHRAAAGEILAPVCAPAASAGGRTVQLGDTRCCAVRRAVCQLRYYQRRVRWLAHVPGVHIGADLRERSVLHGGGWLPRYKLTGKLG